MNICTQITGHGFERDLIVQAVEKLQSLGWLVKSWHEKSNFYQDITITVSVIRPYLPLKESVLNENP